MQTGEQSPREMVGSGWLKETQQALEQSQQFRRLARGILAVWLAGLSVAQYDAVSSHESEPLVSADCAEEISCHQASESLGASAKYFEDFTAPAEIVTTTTLPPETTTTALPPVVETTQAPATTLAPTPLVAEAVRPTIDPRVEEAIDAVSLTPEGYQQFLDSINYRHQEYAQQFPEFNPNQNGVSQNPAETEYATWHFTVIDMEVPDLVRTVATRGDDSSTPDHTCCGFNNVIDNDPNQTFYQLAPWEAHLSHNPPDDNKQVGTEVMAATQADITTIQYEKLSYWTIAVAKMKGWLGNRAIADYARGHGEERDKFKANHPESKLGSRDDFDGEVAERLRQEITEDLTAHPEIMDIEPALR